MNSFKKIFLITILILFSGNVFADNHAANSELVEKAKEITKEIENKTGKKIVLASYLELVNND